MKRYLLWLLLPFSCAGSLKEDIKPNIMTQEIQTSELDSIVLGGGCFWCLDAVYRNMEGIEKIECGYSNGLVKKPTYKEVCTCRTQCVEVVKLYFDTQKTNLEEILTVFWRIHDPTTLNRQGNDIGTQYRSGIYFSGEAQERLARKSLEAASESGLWDDPIVTEIVPIKDYSTAEDYHQNYYEGNKSQPYCVFVVGEKVEKFKKLFKDKLKN